MHGRISRWIVKFDGWRGIQPPAIPPPAHPPVNPPSHRAGEKAQFIHSISERPELPSVQTHESYESTVQKKSWRSGGQRPDWWYDCSGPQGSQWRSRDRVVSRMCRGYARAGISMDPKLYKQNQLTSGDILTPRRKYAQSTCTDTTQEFHKSLRRAELESWEIYSAQIRHTWNRRTSCATIERRHFVSIGSV